MDTQEPALCPTCHEPSIHPHCQPEGKSWPECGWWRCSTDRLIFDRNGHVLYAKQAS